MLCYCPARQRDPGSSHFQDLKQVKLFCEMSSQKSNFLKLFICSFVRTIAIKVKHSLEKVVEIIGECIN